MVYKFQHLFQLEEHLYQAKALGSVQNPIEIFSDEELVIDNESSESEDDFNNKIHNCSSSESGFKSLSQTHPQSSTSMRQNSSFIPEQKRHKAYHAARSAIQQLTFLKSLRNAEESFAELDQQHCTDLNLLQTNAESTISISKPSSAQPVSPTAEQQLSENATTILSSQQKCKRVFSVDTATSSELYSTIPVLKPSSAQPVSPTAEQQPSEDAVGILSSQQKHKRASSIDTAISSEQHSTIPVSEPSSAQPVSSTAEQQLSENATILLSSQQKHKRASSIDTETSFESYFFKKSCAGANSLNLQESVE
ncbi:predicted protein [Uncinocarpus reesii 1704]|uniref:Uncharacterized protein n=1 Tax=Uncinocarpus reesii (strain UAMH 1704) TaxID=336963 RepID=C4JXW6_UNCRE|nr:uncharacterized protein UREG_07017 [Uncinocarpus reesii 1704]EEP82152.1 predicted protein [Uncinocarpus reesii 1704]